MLLNKKATFVFLFLLVALFMAGVFRLFVLRFEAGDVYPPYSSLRSDPLGTRAFCDSLENLKTVSVKRNYRPLSDVHSGRDTTLFFLGTRSFNMGNIRPDLAKAFDRFVLSGGRLVISFFPVKEKPRLKKAGRFSEKSQKNGEAREQKSPSKDKQTPSRSNDASKKHKKGKDRPFPKFFNKSVSIKDHWGVSIRYYDKSSFLKDAKRVDRPETKTLPYSMSWHTALYFHEPQEPWRAIYARNDLPVIIERQFGIGSIILCADSYLFSNEALRQERHPKLLSWFIGKNAGVIFDEAHFGIKENPGIVSLARKYRLHWPFFVLILLAVLFVWKNSTYFIPPRDDDPSTGGNDFISEKDYTEGLISLLRRNISQRRILDVYFNEWEKTLVPGNKMATGKLEKIKGLIERKGSRSSKQGDPVKTYQTIYRILSEGNGSWKIRRKF
ncbi:MAG: DUF4350 domain-containing protein [Deltaproteobacteria bacterium]|nr:DUF4350 domain-containing protein [Deltaproteobacteria bacterium]MBW2117625.1 DUF4350 domain-containing protein [Deltaproteobacteria bacterium]MBW2343947.1 DUF4350 domain-containing protein [Deltaproteobacteria bacterium]